MDFQVLNIDEILSFDVYTCKYMFCCYFSRANEEYYKDRVEW